MSKGHISKSKAFFIIVICIFIMFMVFIVLQYLDKAEGFPIGHFLTAIVSIGTCFIGLEVANNGVRGKYFNEGVSKIDATKEESKNETNKI